MEIIARIRCDFPSKFGLPRQSGLAEHLRAAVVFEPEYRRPEALRGIEGFSHLWLIWGFHRAERSGWSPTVRPPRLGGNERVGVFATRSPFRPNPIGLSCVRLEAVEYGGAEGPVLIVSGADMMDGTPVYDIKPYIAYADAHPEATGGFTAERSWQPLRVELPQAVPPELSKDQLEALKEILAQDPRPAYQRGEERSYGFAYAGCEVRFRVSGDVLTVEKITRAAQ